MALGERIPGGHGGDAGRIDTSVPAPAGRGSFQVMLAEGIRVFGEAGRMRHRRRVPQVRGAA